MRLGLAILGIALFAGLAYWELVIAEGIHLGPRVVAYLYDVFAPRYNRVKQFNPPDEAWFLSDPLTLALQTVTAPLILDVATGTGRLPIALLAHPDFQGRVIALDSSRAMLAQAARIPALSDRLTLIWQDARRLPFDENVFDAVTCLEALEFMPNTRQALIEMARVLRPGGLLLVTNRVGPWARFLPGHTQSRPAFEAMLASLGFDHIQSQLWQVEYNLVWALKPEKGSSGTGAPDGILRCPACRAIRSGSSGALARGDDGVACIACGRAYPLAPDGVIEMM